MTTLNDKVSLGRVYLVGGGPGDPGLLTLRGKACLEAAEVVVYDSLSNALLLDHAVQADAVFVGKEPGKHPLPQEEINRILLEQARQGKRVVRLKGGDPFVFGRGGEEADALAEAGIPFEIVPGVTAGIAAAAYAGIPVTHRGVSSSVTLMSGHGAASETVPDIAAIGREGTLVFYMAVQNLERTVEAVVGAGRPITTPVAVVEWGTYPRQRTIIATLDTIVAEVAAAKIESPAIVVVGEVVRLRDTLAWFESRPLHGRRVALARSSSRSNTIAERLRDWGAAVFDRKVVDMVPDTAGPLPDNLGNFDWIVLGSVNAADMMWSALRRAGCDIRGLGNARFCALGNAAREAVEAHLIKVDAAPDDYSPERLVEAMQRVSGSLQGARLLMPRSDTMRKTIAEQLREAGAVVEEWQAYEARLTKTSMDYVVELLASDPELLAFTNTAAVQRLAEMAQGQEGARVREIPVAVLGPVTAEAAREHGFTVVVEPRVHRTSALADAIAEYFRSEVK